MPNNGYFDIKQDIEIANDGGFFCEACLVGIPKEEQSADPRFCRGCYRMLDIEAELDSSNRKSDWKPINTQYNNKSEPLSLAPIQMPMRN